MKKLESRLFSYFDSGKRVVEVDDYDELEHEVIKKSRRLITQQPRIVTKAVLVS